MNYAISNDHNYAINIPSLTDNTDHNYCAKAPNDREYNNMNAHILCHNNTVFKGPKVHLFNDHTYSMFDSFTVVSINVDGLKQRSRSDTFVSELISNDISLVQETKYKEANVEETVNEYKIQKQIFYCISR